MQHKNMAPQDSHSPSQERVENNTGSVIPALKCVRYTEVGTLYPEIVVSGVNDDVRGITQSIVQNASSGYILCYGFMYNVDTSAWAPGTSLFCDANGDLTTVSGGGPQVANVLKQDAVTGVIGVTCLDTPAALQVTVQDTDSIDMDTVGNIINSDLRISAAAASANHEKAVTTVKSSPNPGVHVEYPWADTDTNGILTAADWNVFFNRVQQGDNRLSVANVFKVKKNPGTGEFSSIATAVAAALSASPSASSPYVVHVAPGVYTEPQIDIPPYVYVVGYSVEATIVEPDANNHHVFKIGENAGIAFLAIRNAGVGFAGVHAEDTGFDSSLLHKVDLITCDIGILAQTSVGATDEHFLYLEYVSFESCTVAAIHSNNLGSATLSLSAENIYVYADGTDTPDAVLIEGGVKALITGGTIERDGTTFGNAIRAIEDGALDLHSLDLYSWSNGVFGEDTSSIKMSSVTFNQCDTNIRVLDIGVSGYFEGYSEHSKTLINTDSPFFVTNKDSRIITVAKKGGDFTSVKDAVDSILDASTVNRYIIQVGPGIFQEDPIVCKPYMSLQGADDSVSIILANDPTQPLITGSHNSELKSIQLRGPTNVGVPLIQHTGADVLGSSFSVIECAFENADLIFNVNGNNTFPTLLRSEGCRITSATTLVNSVLSVDGTASAPAFVFFSDFIYRRVIAPYSDHLFEVAGPNAQVVLSNVLVETNANSTHGMHVENGSKVDIISTAFSGFDVGLHVHNSGSAPTIQTSNFVVRDCTSDIQIDHPGTTGSISAIADSTKTTVNSSAPLTVTLTSDLSDGGLLASGPLKMGRKFSSVENVLDLLEGTPGMGIISGGFLTDNGGFDVGVTAGFGYLEKTPYPDHSVRRVSWNNTSITLGPNQDMYVFFNNSGILTSAASIGNTTSIILIGRVVTNSVGIELIDQSPVLARNSVNFINRALREGFGSVYDSGSIVTENATPFKYDITSGVYFYSFNRFTPTGGTAVTFNQYYRDGLGGYNTTVSDTVNNTQYDDGSGTLQPLTPGYYTAHTVYINCDDTDEKYFVVLGQAEYSAFAAVESSPLPTPPPWIKDAVTPIARIVIQEGAANTLAVYDIRPVIGFKSSGVSATADHGNLLGLSDDDHQQYLLVNGVRAMAANLNMGGNSINNVDLVDGVDVSAHASRHLPNGADPLTTAAPITAVGGNTTNDVGTANSMARSDHQHAIVTGVPSTLTPDLTNAAGTSNALARADHIHNVPAATAVSLSATTTNAEGNSTSFARANHTHAIGSAAAITQTPDQANAVGVSTSFARADHIHNVPTAAPIQINADGSNNQGVATTFARADHKHDIATAAPVTQTPDQANAAGVSTSLARADHVHNIPADAPTTTLSPATTNAEGAGTSFARNDHTHAIATGLVGDVSTIVPDASASAGVVDRFARADHTHAIVADIPVTQNPDQANAEGVSTSFARADHVHNIPADAPVTQNPDQANAEGVSTSFARADHVHNIPADIAVSIDTSTVNAEGNSTSFARANHTHAVSILTQQATATADTTTTSGTDVVMTGMTLTPGAGTYLVMFSGSVETSSNNADIFVNIYVNGAVQSHTERQATNASSFGSAAGSCFPVATQTVATVAGGQAIDVRWRRSAGTATSHERTLTLVRLSN